MARGTTLGQLETMLREEAGLSTNAAMGQNAAPRLRRLLQRTQEFLWADYAWPFLRVDRDATLLAGQSVYSFTTLGLDFSRIEAGWVNYNDCWTPLAYGIAPGHYNAVDTDLGETEDPPRRWMHHESGYEVWPAPATDGMTVRFRGIRTLTPLLDEASTADLDDNLIVLYAAAELLAGKGDKQAPSMRAMADKLYLTLKGNSQKNTMFISGGGLRADAARVVGAPLYGKRQET